MSVEPITATELSKMLSEGVPLVLLDVREDEERGYCAIKPGRHASDLHIPMREIPARVEEITSPYPIVVYCHHGVRSMVVANWLERRGMLNLKNLDGGIDAWSLQVDAATPRY